MFLSFTIAVVVGLLVGLVATLARRGGIVAFLSMAVAFLTTLSLLGLPPIGLLASPGGMLFGSIVGLLYLGVSFVAAKSTKEL